MFKKLFKSKPKYKQYLFTPKKDITAYELAIIWIAHRSSKAVNNLPANCYRHLEEIKT